MEKRKKEKEKEKKKEKKKKRDPSSISIKTEASPKHYPKLQPTLQMQQHIQREDANGSSRNVETAGKAALTKEGSIVG